MLLLRLPPHPQLFICVSRSATSVVTLTNIVQSSSKTWESMSRGRRVISFQGSVKFVQTLCRNMSVTGLSPANQEKSPPKFLRDKKMVPDADPPSLKDVNLLYQFFDQSTKLTVLTGAGISTECGIPDYRSPNGAYSSGFKPITHQVI